MFGVVERSPFSRLNMEEFKVQREFVQFVREPVFFIQTVVRPCLSDCALA